jgi:hypothetical protein
VVEVIADQRQDNKTCPISPGRYLWDLSFENMGKLTQLQERGVDIFAVPLQFIHRRRYKGKHPFSFYEFNEVEAGNEKPTPEPSAIHAAASPKVEPAPPIVPKPISSAAPSPKAEPPLATIPKAVSPAASTSTATRSPATQPSRPFTEHGTPLRSSGILYDEYGEIADDCGDNWWKALKDDEIKALGKWERDEKAKATTREQQMALEAMAQTIKGNWKETGILQLPGVAGEVKATTAQEQKAAGTKANEQAAKGQAPSIEPSQQKAMKAEAGEAEKVLPKVEEDPDDMFPEETYRKNLRAQWKAEREKAEALKPKISKSKDGSEIEFNFDD